MIIQSERVWIAGSFMKAAIRIESNKITSILPYGSAAPDIDYGTKRIVPGFIDVHTHGAYGYDTNNPDPEGLKQWAKAMPKEGVTAFLPTTVTYFKDGLLKAVANVADVKDQQVKGDDGAEILGIHFEGPYLNIKHKGAQPPEAIVPPSIEEFKEYQSAARGNIKVITVAPENDTDFEFIHYLHETGVRVSMGHTDADYATAMLAAANGVTCVTHTYNAQTPFNHRNNGVVGASLRLKNLYGEIICDCAHSTPEALNIFFTSKGRDRAIMISDALMCKGFKPGETFIFGGHEIEIWEDGCAHLMDIPEHSIAGSTMHTNDGLRNLVEKALVPFDAAINSCTLNPARYLGMDDHLGMLCAGYDADIVVLNDDYTILETYCKGVKQLSE